MKPLIVLLVVFFLGLIGSYQIENTANPVFAGNLGMSVMLLFTALGHFKFADGMAMMVPDFMPLKRQLVLLTGLLEIAAAIGLLIPAYRSLTSIILIIFFIVLLPANINAAVKHIDYEKATTTGVGTSYLWFRVPLQILFIVWVYYFGVN